MSEAALRLLREAGDSPKITEQALLELAGCDQIRLVELLANVVAASRFPPEELLKGEACLGMSFEKVRRLAVQLQKLAPKVRQPAGIASLFEKEKDHRDLLYRLSEHLCRAAKSLDSLPALLKAPRGLSHRRVADSHETLLLMYVEEKTGAPHYQEVASLLDAAWSAFVSPTDEEGKPENTFTALRERYRRFKKSGRTVYEVSALRSRLSAFNQ
jgi:hypothetical protein